MDKLLKYSLYIILAAVVIVYSQIVAFDFTLDDGFAIVNNDKVQQGFSGIQRIWTEPYSDLFTTSSYRPLTLTVFNIVYTMGNGSPLLFHLMSLIGYLGLGVVAYKFLSDFTKNKKLLVISLGFFMLHPLHVESVASIKSFDDILSSILILLYLIYLRKYYQTENYKTLVFSLSALFLAFFTKESSVAFIFAPLMFMNYNNQKYKKTFLPLFLTLISFVIFFGVYKMVLGDSGANASGSVVNNTNLLGSGFDYYRLAGHKIIVYVGQVILPYNLSWNYEYGAFDGNIAHMKEVGIIGLLLVVSLISFTIYSGYKKLKYFYPLLFLILSFGISSNLLISLDSTMANRLLFLPLLTISMLICLSTDKLAGSKFYAPVSVIVLVVFSVLSFNRASVWKSDLSIMSNDVENCNSCRTLAGYLYTTYEADGLDKSYLFEKVSTTHKHCLDTLGLAYITGWGAYQLGNIMFEKGDSIGAMNLYAKGEKYKDSRFYNRYMIGRKRIEYHFDDPLGDAYILKAYEMGTDKEKLNSDIAWWKIVVHMRKGEVENAKKTALEALKLDPSNFDITSMLGQIYHSQGDYINAKIYLNKVLDEKNTNEVLKVQAINLLNELQ
jgi:hypothetical protein